MKDAEFISIDQNSHALWDTLPKLQAAAKASRSVDHYVEDIDSAFTRRGSEPGDNEMEISLERYYRDGSQDWGAALFYPGFLGRTAIDLHEIEPLLGCSLKSLAKQLNTSIDDLYHEYSASDTRQLIGSSYVYDKQYHRVIGDLSMSEVKPHLKELFAYTEKDMLRSFPDRDSQERIKDWCETEWSRVKGILSGSENSCSSSLVGLYLNWLNSHLSQDLVSCGYTSNLFQTEKCPAIQGGELFQNFLAHYSAMADCYNKAVDCDDVKIKPLNKEQGELPFFVVWNYDERLLRSPLYFRDGYLLAADKCWPVESSGREKTFGGMDEAGVFCITGKALPLVLQVRMGRQGKSLLLPYRGSEYMPAAYRFEHNLKRENLLQKELSPVTRVRFHFLERIGQCGDTSIRLPKYLQEFFNAEVLTAAEFSEHQKNVRRNTGKELEKLRTEKGYNDLEKKVAPELLERIECLENERKRVAQQPENRARASALWKEIKTHRKVVTERVLDYTIRLLHVSNLDYWDSRGAIYPWSIALGGNDFYQSVLNNAEFYEEL